MKSRLQSITIAFLLGLCAAGGAAAVTYEYDGLYRLTKITYDDGSAIVFEYDRTGNRAVRVIQTDPNSVYLSTGADPPDSGTVIRDPNQDWYTFGSSVDLTADPEECTFDGWSGDVPQGHETDNPLTITMDDHKSLTAEFGSPLGDLNCDCVINSLDIDPFVLALTDSHGYRVAHPDCNQNLADCNSDGSINSLDIDVFVALLTGG